MSGEISTIKEKKRKKKKDDDGNGQISDQAVKGRKEGVPEL